MICLRSIWLPVLAVVGAVIGLMAAFVAQGSGAPTPALGVTGPLPLVVAALVCLGFGLRIRADRRRELAARMDPLAAARVLVLAQASGFAGALLGGWHAGVAVQLLTRAVPAAPILRDCLLMAAVGAVIAVVTLLVEQWCRVGGDDSDGDGALGQDGRNGGRQGRAQAPDAEGGFARASDGT